MAQAWFGPHRSEKSIARLEYEADLALVLADENEARCLIGSTRVDDVIAEQERKRKEIEYADWMWCATH